MNDKVFTKPIKKQFEFDAEVAAVFDDMLERSVPFYKESQKITQFFTHKNLSEKGIVYDLGCSTASLLLNIHRKLEVDAQLIGLDNSEAMLEQARKKCEAYNADIEVINADILEYPYEEADVFISNYTLQFIRPLVREELVKKIASSLKKQTNKTVTPKSKYTWAVINNALISMNVSNNKIASMLQKIK